MTAAETARLVGLLNAYGTAKFGDEWWPGEAAPVIGEQAGAELAALLAAAGRVHAACEYVLDGTDADGTPWYRCVTHDELAPSSDAPCAGYYPPPYTDPRGK